MKRRSSIILIFALLISLCACNTDTTSETNPTNDVVAENETTIPETTVPETEPSILTVVEDFDADAIAAMVQWQNNSQNGAMFTAQDGWIYGTSSDSNGNVVFVKCRTDFTDWTILDYGWVYHPYIKDGYIYYMLYSPKGESESGLFKMRVSGEGKERLSDIFGQMQLWGDTIFFSKEDEENTDAGNHLYSIDLDGSDFQELIDRPVFHWFVFGDFVLYQDDRDNESLHITDFDGNDVKLNDETSYWPIFDGSYIYYTKNVDEDRSIWRIDIDGKNDTQIADYAASRGFVLHGDKIYFVYEDDSDRIYSINKDGSGLLLITQDKDCAEIQFIGEILKYTDLEPKGNSYYIDAIMFCEDDGTEIVDFVQVG